MLHTIIDLEPGLLSWLVSLWQTLSIYIWSIGQSSDRPSCFRKFHISRKEPSLPNTFSNDYHRILIFSQSFMWMSLHGHSFADHTKASDNNFQCIFQSTWGVRPWGSSSDISLSRTRLKKKKKRSKFDWKCSSFLDWWLHLLSLSLYLLEPTLSTGADNFHVVIDIISWSLRTPKYYCRCSARLVQVNNGCGIIVLIWSTWMILTKRFGTCVAWPWYISIRTSGSHTC